MHVGQQSCNENQTIVAQIWRYGGSKFVGFGGFWLVDTFPILQAYPTRNVRLYIPFGYVI